jgi:hypothetical protein
MDVALHNNILLTCLKRDDVYGLIDHLLNFQIIDVDSELTSFDLAVIKNIMHQA